MNTTRTISRRRHASALMAVFPLLLLLAGLAAGMALAPSQPAFADDAPLAAGAQADDPGQQATGPEGEGADMQASFIPPSYIYYLTIDDPDHKYSDGVIGYNLNVTAGNHIIIDSLSEGTTWFKPPDTINLDNGARAQVLNEVSQLLYQYKAGAIPEEDKWVVEGCFWMWLGPNWQQDGYTPVLDEAYASAVPVDSVMLYQDHNAADTLTSVSFEYATSNHSSLPLEIDGFENCTKLTQVTLPANRPYTLRWGAFKNTGVSSVNLNGCVYAEDSAFEGCKNLASVNFGSTIASIYKKAFKDCTGLTSIALPDSLRTIGTDAFQGCTSLASVTWPNNEKFTTVNGFDGCTSLSPSVVTSLPATVTSIGNVPGMSDVQTDYYGNRVTTGAFSNCSFTSLDIPSTVTSIGAYAFAGCSGLDGATVVLPPGLQALGQKAFSISDPEAAANASITLRFTNPDFMFTQLTSASEGVPLISAEATGTTGDLYYHPFTNTQVQIEAPSKGSDGETSPLKNAFDNFFVRESAADIYATGVPFDDCVLADGTGRREYTLVTSWADGQMHRVTGTVPKGATVIVTRAVAGRDIPAATSRLGSTQDSATFTASVLEGADVKVRVSLPGYHDRTFERAAADFTADWDLGTLAEADFTPVDASAAKPTGTLSTYREYEIVAGKAFVVQMRYQLPAGVTSGLATFTLPEGARLYSASDDDAQLAVSVDLDSGSRVATVPVPRASGTMYVRMSLADEGEATIGAAITCDGVVGAVDPLTITSKRVHIRNCPDVLEDIAGHHMTVSTLPGADVVVKIGGSVVSEPAKANSAGSAHVSFSLPADAVLNQEYELVVEANGGTATKKVLYRLSGGDVVSWDMERTGDKIPLVKDGRLQAPAYYIAFWPEMELSDAYWSFTATIATDEPLENQVRVEARGADGGVLLTAEMAIVSERTEGGRHVYDLAGVAVDQHYLAAFQAAVDGNPFDYVYRVPRSFVLTDGEGLDIGTTLDPSIGVSGVPFAQGIVFSQGIIDPSGTVFEAVPGNLLSGVSATIRVADDAAGTGARNWTEAPDFDQETTIVTGAAGAYAWDTPEGWWQVAFEKEGYVPVTTDWMQVSPPRVGLQTAMVSTALPVVKASHAYGDAIEVEFSQYMKTGASGETASGASVVVDGVDVDAGRLEWTDCEESLEGEALSRTLLVKPAAGKSFSGTVSLGVSGARNYAGNAMASAYAATLPVAAQKPVTVAVSNARAADVSDLQLDPGVIAFAGYSGQATVFAGSAAGVPVKIEVKDGASAPVAGASLTVSVPASSGFLLGTSAAAAASGAASVSATTGDDGAAVVYVFAAAPGVADLSVAVDGSSLVAEALMQAVSGKQTFDVTFVYGNGDGPAVVQVEEGAAVAEPATNPERDGYRFDHWYAGETDEGAYDFSTPVTGPLTLTAKWVARYTVSAAADDAAHGSVKIGEHAAAASDSVTVDAGGQADVAAIAETGWHFVRWTEGGETVEGAGATYTISGIAANHDLVAVFEKDYVPVTSIGGIPAAGACGTDLQLNGIVVPDGATSAAITWSLVDAGGTGATVSSSGLVSGAASAGTVKVRATIANGLAPGSDYTQDFEIVFSEPAATTHSVTFVYGNGDTTVEEVDEGAAVAEPDPAPSRPGHRFDHWYAGDTDTGAYDFSTPVTGPLTLTAKWVAQYTVGAAADPAEGGKVQIDERAAAASDSLTVDEGAAVEVTAVAAEGWRLVRWIVGDEAVPSVDTLQLKSIAASYDLVAVFEKDSSQGGGDGQQDEAARAAQALIDALPAASAVTLADEPAVVAARASYDALDADQQALVPDETKKHLTDAEARIAELKAAADQSAAERAAQAQTQAEATAVASQIDTLPDAGALTLDDAGKVAAARASYDALTPAAKDLVPAAAVSRLESAEARIAELKDAADQPTAKKKQTIKAKKRTQAVKASKLAKRNVSFTLKKASKITGAKTALVVSKAKATVGKKGKKSAKRWIKVTKAGKVTVKKGAPKGYYKLVYTVRAKATSAYQASNAKKVTLYIRVR